MDQKGANLTSILMSGSVVSLVCLPLFGSLSDVCTHRLVSRHLYINSRLFLCALFCHDSLHLDRDVADRL